MQYGSGDADDYIGIRLDYQTYHALNWTIVADENGTTFTSRETLPICAAGGLTTPMGSSGSRHGGGIVASRRRAPEPATAVP